MTQRPRHSAPFLLITLCFSTLIYCFLVEAWGKVEEREIRSKNVKKYLAHKTVRNPILEPVYTRNRMTYRCNECHQNFKTKRQFGQKKLIGEHGDLKLNHGSNDRCLNCHHLEDREAFVNHDGSKILYENSIQLCAKCHGPKYRDWKLGLHGKSTGYWSERHGPSKKIHCVSCHDPHDPEFKALEPAPGPHRPHHKGGH